MIQVFPQRVILFQISEKNIIWETEVEGNISDIYVNKNGKYCIDKTIERSNTPSHCEYDSEEAAVMKVLHFCSFNTGISYSDNAKSAIIDMVIALE